MRNAFGAGLGVILLVGLYYAITIPSSDVGSAPSNEPITIGFIGPLTGDAAEYNIPIKNAVFLAVKDLKAQGKNIEVVYEDGGCDGDMAARALNKLVAIDKVKVVIGGACNGETLAMAPVAEREHVVLFSPSASSPDVTGAGQFVFRNVPSDTATSEALARLAHATHSSVAILSEAVDSTHDARTGFGTAFSGDGGDVVFDEAFAPDERDFKGLIKRIRESGAEAVMLNPQTESLAGAFMKQFRKSGATSTVYGMSVLGGGAFLDAAGEAADGIVFADYVPLDAANPQAQAFLEDYRKFFGEPKRDFAIASAYDAVNLIVQAAGHVGYDGPRIRDYLYNLPQYDGLAGKYSFDLNGDVVGALIGFKAVNKGAVERYTPCYKFDVLESKNVPEAPC